VGLIAGMDALEGSTTPSPKNERENIRDDPETLISFKPASQGRVFLW
jgi:hypothetical protein